MNQLAILLNFSRQDLVDRYANSLLGVLWAFLFPLVNILVFVLVFSKIMGARLGTLGEEFNQYGYSIYLISGVLAWNAFAQSLLRISTIYSDKREIITKVRVSLPALPLYILLTESVIYLISMGFFVLFLLAIGFPITAAWLWIIPVFILQMLFAYALGFLAATLGVFLKDVREFVQVLVQLWFWMTPIVYVTGILSPGIRDLFVWNPAYAFIDAYHQVIVHAQAPRLGSLMVFALVSALLLVVEGWFYRHLERDIRDFI